MFKWWKLIKFLSITFGVRVLAVNLNHDSGCLRFNSKTNKTLYIRIPILPTRKTFLIFIHELGHHLHPLGKADDLVLSELSAWTEAFKLFRELEILLTIKEYQMMRCWFSTYAARASRNNPDAIFNILKVFDKAFLEYYIKGEK